jgi:hypothetical protein
MTNIHKCETLGSDLSEFVVKCTYSNVYFFDFFLNDFSKYTKSAFYDKLRQVRA